MYKKIMIFALLACGFVMNATENFVQKKLNVLHSILTCYDAAEDAFATMTDSSQEVQIYKAMVKLSNLREKTIKAEDYKHLKEISGDIRQVHESLLTLNRPFNHVRVGNNNV